MTFFTFVIAVLMAVVIWRTTIYFLRMLAVPPEEIDPTDIRETMAHYRCQVCGAEVTMTMANEAEMGALRHCREEMVLVWRPEGLENPPD